MVGVNTVLRDNPRLEAVPAKEGLVKIVIDSTGTPADSNIFSGSGKVIIFTLPFPPGQETENRKNLAAKCKIIETKEKNGQVNLVDAFKKIARMGISNIIVEGGGTLIGSLFDERLVDKVSFFISPKIIGGREAISSVMGKGAKRIEQAIKLGRLKVRRFSEDLFIEADGIINVYGHNRRTREVKKKAYSGRVMLLELCAQKALQARNRRQHCGQRGVPYGYLRIRLRGAALVLKSWRKRTKIRI